MDTLLSLTNLGVGALVLALGSLPGHLLQMRQDKKDLAKLKLLVEENSPSDLSEIKDLASSDGSNTLNIIYWSICSLFWFAGIGGGGVPLALGVMFLSFLGVRKVIQTFDWGRIGWKRRLRKQVKTYALEGQEQSFARLAWAMGMSPKRRRRKIGIKALKKWNRGNRNRLASSSDKAPGVSLFSAMQSIKESQWEPLPEIKFNHLFWQLQAPKERAKNPLAVLKYLIQEESLSEEERKFLVELEQMQYKGWDGYCMKHYARATKSRFGEFHVFYCEPCGNRTNVVFPVKEVVGQIYGESEEKLEAGTLKVTIWDPKTQTITLKEIDRLEVHPGSQTDWAVAAYLEKHRNQFPNRRPVVKLMPGAEISANTRKMLEQMK